MVDLDCFFYGCFVDFEEVVVFVIMLVLFKVVYLNGIVIDMDGGG